MSETDENVEEITSDEEEEIEEEEFEEESEESIYDTADFISEPSISEKCTIPFEIFDFEYPFPENFFG